MRYGTQNHEDKSSIECDRQSNGAPPPRHRLAPTAESNLPQQAADIYADMGECLIKIEQAKPHPPLC